MRPKEWRPPVEVSTAEAAIIGRIRRGRLFGFLRKHRHELFDTAMQAELAGMYDDSAKGQPPVPPALLALATILQAYVGLSDDEVIEATMTDRRWEMVLDCLDTDTAPFSKGTLVAFRERLIKHEMDRRLVERTVEVARETGGIGATNLRVALDSSPLWGAGRVEDTLNLLGHALRKALGMIARQQGRGLTEIAEEAGVEVLGGPSLKAALDLDWDDAAARTSALGIVLQALDAVERHVSERDIASADVVASLDVAHQIRAQDVVSSPADGTPTLRACLRRVRPSAWSAAIQHGYEPSTLPNRPDRRPVGRYTGSDPDRQIGRKAAHDGHAAGDERHPLHHGDGRSMADAASGVPAVADGVQLLPDLDEK